MVGGDDYDDVAVQPRHAGPAPARLLVQAVHARRGATRRASRPNSTWASHRSSCSQSRKLDRALHGQQLRRRVLRRHHAGERDDVLRQLGVRPGRHQGRHARRVARLARRMGIRTPVSHNLAMTLGGLKQGVTPLDMAHAYETLRQPRPADLRLARARARATARAGRAGPGRDRVDHRACRATKPVELPGGGDAVNRKRDAPGARDPSRRPGRSRDAADRREVGHRRPGRADPRRTSSPARPARPRTTATPGSSAGPRSTPSRSGSATRTSSSR